MFRNRAFVGSQVSDWQSAQKIKRDVILDGSTAQLAANSAIQILSVKAGVPSGNYWININGVPTQIYCDMTSDGGGWMLYSSFSSDNPFSSSFPAINGNRILLPSFSTYGYSYASITNYSDGVNGSLAYERKSGYYAHFNSGSPVSYFYMNTYTGPSNVTEIRVKHGTGSTWGGSGGEMYTNEVLRYSDPVGYAGQDVTSVFPFSPYGTTPLLKQIEYGIAGMSWIFVR